MAKYDLNIESSLNYGKVRKSVLRNPKGRRIA